jgi:LacI family xylobiose transport system transcriptional regulator
LARVAAEAAVSLSTVSKVLNGRDGIAAETRSRVEQLLRDHGYARRDVDRSSSMLEVVFNELDAWTMKLIRGVEAVTRENGLAAMLTESGDRYTAGSDWVDRSFARRPVGVIFVFAGPSATDKRALTSEGIPFVVLDPLGNPEPDVPSVGAANWYGGVLATQHLISLGHTKIATITGPADMMSSRARLSGYRSALEEAGVTPQAKYIAAGTYYKPESVVLGRQLLTLKDPPTAIFAGNDVQALGIYEAAAELGLRIPEDVSVVGFDDLDVAEWAGPPLTTVRQPLVEMGAEAARLVLALRSSPREHTLRMDLATSLVVRDSTRRIN